MFSSIMEYGLEKRFYAILLTLTSFLIWAPYANGSTVRTTLSSRINATTTPQCVVQVVPTEWKKEDFPNPQVDLGRCGRDCQKSWICDPNNVLTDNYYATRIDNLLSSIRINNVCGCQGDCSGRGFKMSLALVNRMKFESWETVSSSIKTSRARDFANYLRSTSWHPPNTCQDDVVIFISRGDRKVQTSVGPSAIDVITPSCIEDVYNKAKSDLSAGYFDKAAYYMIQRYERAIVNGNCDDGETSELSVGAIVGIVIAVIAFPAIIIALCCFCGCCRGGGGGWGSSHHHHHHGWGWGGSSSGGGGGGGGFSFGGSGDGGGSGGGDF